MRKERKHENLNYIHNGTQKRWKFWFIPLESRLFRGTENARNSVPSHSAEDKKTGISVPNHFAEDKSSVFRSEPFCHFAEKNSVYIYLTWGPFTWGRAPLCIHVIGTERRAQARPTNKLFEPYEPGQNLSSTSGEPELDVQFWKFQPLSSPWGIAHNYMLRPKGIELFTEDQAFQLSHDLATTLVPLSCQQVFSLFLSVYLFVAGQAYWSESSGGGGGGAKSYDGDKKPSPL